MTSLKGSGRSGATRRVLIVEDEPLVGMNLRACLEDAGAHVVWVQSDRGAYAALGGPNPAFDTLVLDIDLGKGTTGFDIARYARSRIPDVGIIFSSGSPPDWLKSFGVEGALFVPKPCNEHALLAAFSMVHEQAANDTGMSEMSEMPQGARNH